MKLLLLLLVVANTCFAQTMAEWVRQKETQEKYLLQQIAALKVYSGYVKKGYQLVQSGLQNVRNIKRGDLTLHQDFINGLSRVNPRLKQLPKVAAIVTFQLRIVKNVKECLRTMREMGQLSVAELEHCGQVLENLLTATLVTIDELLAVLTDGQQVLRDDERLKRIDVLHSTMQEHYAFSAAYSEELAMLTMQRLHNSKETTFSKQIYGLP